MSTGIMFISPSHHYSSMGIALYKVLWNHRGKVSIQDDIFVISIESLQLFRPKAFFTVMTVRKALIWGICPQNPT